MRNILIIALIVIALALLRGLVSDVVKAVKKSVAAPGDGSKSASGTAGSTDANDAKTGRLVKDPVSGTYIDENVAVQEEIDGQVFFFESSQNRDEYIKRARAERG